MTLPRVTERHFFMLNVHARLRSYEDSNKKSESKSRVGQLRDKKDKNRSADDGSVLKSFMNKDFSF